MVGDQRRKLEQRLDVALLRAPCAGRPHPLVHLPDPVCLLRAEAQPEPGFDLVVELRHQGVVARAALVDPPLRREGVEIADDLGLLHRVSGRLDPDVRSPRLRRPFASRAGTRPRVRRERDRARRLLLRPQRRHLSTSRVGILEPLREQRLGGAVCPMPGREQ